MNRWHCTICGYIYDPAVGDVDNGVPQGTPYEALPERWECPRCGVGKELFALLDENSGSRNAATTQREANQTS